MVDLKHNELELFNSDGEYSQDFISLVEDASSGACYHRLEDILDEKKIRYDKNQLNLVISKTEDAIISQLTYYAYLFYAYMEASQDWGDAGEHQVKVSFCRNILNLEPEEDISQEHVYEFMNKVQYEIKQRSLIDINIEKAKQDLKKAKIDILGQSLGIHQAENINRLLWLINSKCFFQGGFYGYYIEFILGEGSHSKRGKYQIFEFQKEYIRSPNTIVAMAAVIGKDEIFIRKESLLTIFNQKWVPCLGSELMDIDRNDINQTISEGIKDIVFDLYNVQTVNEIKNIQSEWLGDMGDTIICHELGHGIIQHHILPQEIAAIGEATKMAGENIFTALLEVLADLAPSNEKICGPLVNMSEISKNNQNKAERMYFMYFSDIWFFDTQDEYMFDYTDCMALVMLSFIDDDKSVNFNELSKQLNYKSRDLNLIRWLVEITKSGLEDLMQIIKSSTFNRQSQVLTYADSEQHIKATVVSKMRKTDSLTDYNFSASFWSEMVEFSLQTSNKSEDIKDFIKNYKNVVLNGLMKLLNSKVANNYLDNTREFIHRECIRLNINS
ncbi:hypothetical protein DID75_01130 [Candidatus Marinamargulisbacteria bacterium SCGC AG-410-N11]|nr:hypothetical protein DID75_01130 [Candidatus Marinamargulisbacteria bacterium SCGC AG-410-N11]